MKNWASDNPKAKLLARKREAILTAARRQFLANGYSGTRMEAVAADAGVSIMTLYRHAESKDDLFAAVVAIACHSPGEPPPDTSTMSLKDILEGTALAFQDKLGHPETMALLRAVIAEQERFPDLAGIAYAATIGHLIAVVVEVLQNRSPAHADGAEGLTHDFVDDLFGADLLRHLLGLSGSSDVDMRRRAELATARLLARLAP